MLTARLDDRVAIITGAANGIGRTTALTLARAGAEIGLLDFDNAGLALIQAEIEGIGQRAIAVPLDCTDPIQVKSAFRQVRAALGPVDILVNDVGQSARGKMTDIANADLDSFDFLIGVNLKSCVLCAQVVVAEMTARGSGRIIHIASESAVMPRSWDYSAAMGGVIGFTRAIAREPAPHGITVNAVGPGLTRTRAVEEMPKGMIDTIIAGTPMRRIAEPEDIANVILFFAGPASDYVTGQTLLVNWRQLDALKSETPAPPPHGHGLRR